MKLSIIIAVTLATVTMAFPGTVSVSLSLLC